MATPEQKAFYSMHRRCRDTKAKSYHRYGGRGISVCERWNSVKVFLEDMGPRPSSGHSLDRINVNGNYSPENCRWATKLEQARNTRKNVNLTYKGRTLCQKEWANQLGISHATLQKRLKKWSLKKALTQPKKINHRFQNRRFLTLNGVTLNIEEWAKKLKITSCGINWRINRYGVEKALTMKKRIRNE